MLHIRSVRAQASKHVLDTEQMFIPVQCTKASFHCNIHLGSVVLGQLVSGESWGHNFVNYHPQYMMHGCIGPSNYCYVKNRDARTITRAAARKTKGMSLPSMLKVLRQI